MTDPSGVELSAEQADALRHVLHVQEASAAALESAVDQWFATQIQNSPASRYVDAYSHILSTLPDLKARVVAASNQE